MKTLYTILLLSLPLFMTLLGQGSWESYNHDYLINKPITSYPYNGGIVMIYSDASRFRYVLYPDEKGHNSHIQYIDSDGKMHFIGFSAEFYGNPIDDIKFVENADSSLSILISKLFDYDIAFPFHRFDISADTINSYYNFDAPDGTWNGSEEPIAMFGEDKYLMARDEFIFVLDEEFEIIDTLNLPNQDFKLCQYGDNPILYNESQVVTIDEASLMTFSNEATDLQSMTYLDNHLFFVTSTELTISDTQFIQEWTWNLPLNSEVRSITGSEGGYFVTIRNADSKVMSLWNATAGQDLIEIEADLSVPGATMAMNSDSIYHYTSTVEMSDTRQQTLVNRTLRDGTFESDYDFVPEIDLSVSDITLDSIVFWRQEIYGSSSDTVNIYRHYYNGELTLTNSTMATIYNANVYSQWFMLDWNGVEQHFNYALEEPLLPGETLQIPIRYVSFLKFDNEQLSFYCYGYNDRRMETPVEAVANILASNEDYNPIEFSVYPNPVGDQLTVQLNEESEIDYAILYDASGKFVKYFYSNDTSYDISGITQGMYYFKLVDNDGRHGTQVIYKE